MKITTAVPHTRFLKPPRALARELIIVLGFIALTSIMTWPWVLHLRDAVADPGDPYMIAWALWWDYHQTFADPLNLFHANVFYPYRYTLAFSEHDYGIALVLFPLFAAGLRPLTVHSVATFLGFAFCGYAAFRLVRTLTGSVVGAFAAGIIFAFIPYRFHLLSHLHYLFAGWIPLLVEALILFTRQRSWKRAAWLGVTFLMNALSCVTWFVLTLIPLTLTVVFLLAWRPHLARDHNFWLRGTVALGLAMLALVPFLAPYYYVSEMYGLKWKEWEFAFNSPSPMSWFSAEQRTKLWQDFGNHIPGGHKLFPGLLTLLLAFASFRLPPALTNHDGSKSWRRRLVPWLDSLAVVATVVAVLAIGYGDKSFRLFGLQIIRTTPATPKDALLIIAVLLAFRLMMAQAVKSVHHKRVEVEAYAIGLIWTVWGFIGSLGANVPINTVLYDQLIIFRSVRIPARNAMICYLGLAVLSGLGVLRLVSYIDRIGFGQRFRRFSIATVVAVAICVALAFELHAFPLTLFRGAVDPDSLAVQLKNTSMRGGLVELPSEGSDLPRHTYMLRAADHGHPLVNATASFVSPVTAQINAATGRSPITPNFLDLLETIPASYLVIHNARIPPDRRTDYEAFLWHSTMVGRLRFINRFDGRDDLYAVTKIEPNAISESKLPFTPVIQEWSEAVRDDPLHVLGQYQEWSQAVCRVYLASFGRLPRLEEFIPDLTHIGRGVLVGGFDQDAQLHKNFNEFVSDWIHDRKFAALYNTKTDDEFLERILANAGLSLDDKELGAIRSSFASGGDVRARTLQKIVFDERFTTKEHARTLVLLHFFGYLRRNPDDPPDKNIDGLLHWISELNKGLKPEHLTSAFADSLERKTLEEGNRR